MATAPVDTRQGSSYPKLPFDDYELTPEQREDLENLVDRVTRRCMRAAGFDSTSGFPAGTGWIARTIREYKSRRYGVTDPGISRAHGYRLSRESRGTADPKPLDSVSGEEGQAVGACGRRARGVVRAVDDDASAQRVGDLGVQVFRRTVSDDRVRAAFVDWSDCMREHGHAYQDPFRAAGDPRWDGEGDTPSAVQIGVALDDISCKGRTRLVAVASTVEAEYQNAELDRNPEVFARARQELTKRGALLSRLLRENPA
ncbi:hypothetical protein [Plantactinospora endophytica]|uniref:hypothetical protein n=1 Tax=Plantactinospora endophytica TaxID=673535 RepID=UPI0019432C93|nr:hypothetical protein [Plantactinospora endophytica]